MFFDKYLGDFMSWEAFHDLFLIPFMRRWNLPKSSETLCDPSTPCAILYHLFDLVFSSDVFALPPACALFASKVNGVKKIRR